MRLLSLFCLLMVSAFADSSPKMNIIFFFADDMGYKDIVGLRDEAVDGKTLYETPAIDEIIKNSRVFTNAYCSGPRCVVARRSVLTGNYDWRPEVVGDQKAYLHPETGEKTSGGIRGENDTFGDPLQAAGYRTCYIGKYHLGASDDVPQEGEEPRGPKHQGFDVEIAAAHEGAPQTSYFAYENPEKKGEFTWGFHGGGLDDTSYMLPEEAEPVKEGEYLTDRLTKKAKGFMEDAVKIHKKPFFLTLAHYAVHTPMEAKEDDLAYFTEKKKKMDFSTHPAGKEALIRDESSAVRLTQDNRVYAAMMKSFDDSLKDLRAYLARTDDPVQEGKKLSETTIIVISSDHGGKSAMPYGGKKKPKNPLENDETDPLVPHYAYSKYPTANYPLRLGKTWVYEGGLKIPLIVHYPGVTDGGGETGAFVHGADFAATFSEMADVTPSAQFRDSISFLDAVKDPTSQKRTVLPHFFTNSNKGTGNYAIAAYREGDYKLMYFMVQRRMELYNISTDPGEQNDLADKKPERVTKMFQKLYQSTLETGFQMPKPDSNTWMSEQKILAGNGVIEALPEPPNAAPTDLILEQTAPNEIKLTWKPNATNATHAVIHRSGVDERGFNEGKNRYREVAYVPISQTTYTDTHFTAKKGEKYNYRIEVENLAGWHGSKIDKSGEFSTHHPVYGETNTKNVTLILE